MPSFETEQDVYARIGRLLVEMAQDPALAAHCQRANAVVRLRCQEPEATITVDLRQDCEPRVDLGATDLEPEIVLSMAAETAHRFFLGEVNVTVALARGQIRATGRVAKALELVPLVRPFFSRYREQLKASERRELTEA